MASMFLMANTQTSNQALTADSITDGQIRELRGHPNEAHARTLRTAAETRAARKRNAAVEKAFAFFGSTDGEQAARANAVQRADLKCAEADETAMTRYRTRCAQIINAGAPLECVTCLGVGRLRDT